MIINPYKITKESVTAPDEVTLRELINQTYEEIGSLRFLLKDTREQVNCKYFCDFLRDSIITNSEILLSISKLSHMFLNSALILMRTFLEIKVDFLWIYSIFLNNNDTGEKLARRFYQFGTKFYLNMSTTFKRIFKNDTFANKMHRQIDIEKDARRAEEFDKFTEFSEMKPKDWQKMDWRALPGLVTNRQQIMFAQRSKVAAEVSDKLFNLKDAPYYHNWKILNLFAHWSSLHYKYVQEDVSKFIYQRNLNIYLGFMHDMINLLLHFMNKPATEKLKMIRNQFIYFST